MKWFFLSLFILVALVYIFILTPFGQNWIGRQVTKRLSRDLHTKVTIKQVDFSLFNRMHLEGIMVEDHQGDTLLYAGDMKLRITDWFFFKKNADLKYIGLENAIIKFQRSDSVWSQQFLFDYFSSPPSSGAKKKEGIQFHFKKVELKNVTFIKQDRWQGQDMTIHFAGLNLDANEIDFSKKIADINTLQVDQPNVFLSDYKRLNPASSKKNTVPLIEADSLLKWNRQGWAINVKKLKIQNGVFKNEKQSDVPALAWFDGRHLLFGEINAELKDVKWNKDTITTHLDLKTKERSGLEIRKMLADIKFTPKEMAFTNLEIQTNNSVIRNEYRMSYDNFSDLGDFIHAVRLQADFENSEIASDDIAFFAPSLKNWKKKISLNGKVSGTIDDLSGRELVVQAGNNTLLNGDIRLTGLPDLNKTLINFKSNEFRTTYGDVVAIYPALRRIKNPDLKKIQTVSFKGNFVGLLSNFKIIGSLATNLGTIRINDLDMIAPRGQEPAFSGHFTTDNFRLGELLGDKNLGSVSLSMRVSRRGTGFKTSSLFITDTIYFADYKNYRYRNIKMKGKLDKNLFAGHVSMLDDNADLVLDGTIDLSNKMPSYNLVAEINKANLKNLNLTKDDFKFKGKLDLNFNGNTIDNFLGYAKITDAEISKGNHRLPFDSLVLLSAYADNEKKLTVISNEFNATVKGDFSMKELPAAFTFLLNKYYPAYVKAPAKPQHNNHIQFDIAALYANELLQLIDSGISGFNNSHFFGNLDLAKNELNFTADIPQFKFRQFNFEKVQVSANGKNDSLILTGGAGNLRINDSINISRINLKIRARKDSSHVSITNGSNQAMEKANINALVLTYKDGVKIEFEASDFTINGKTWTINKNGVLEFRSSTLTQSKLLLQENEQLVVLETQPAVNGTRNDLKMTLTKVNLGDLSPFFLSHNRLEGLLSGTILAENPGNNLNNLKIKSENVQTQLLRLDNDSLGNIKAEFTYDASTGILEINGNTLSDSNGTALNPDNYLKFKGKIFIGDPEKAKNNKIQLEAKKYQINILQRFLGSLFSDIQGYLSGTLNLDGDFKNLALGGKGKLTQAGLKVNFTQVFYKIDSTDIVLTPLKINLDGLVLRDTVTNRPLYVKGSIEHESFKNMFYDIYISTRKPRTTGEENNLPVQLLNTTYKDNKQFYGNVKGTGSLSLVGPQSDMFMKIDAFSSTRARDTSNITIPSSTSRESGLADFLVERTFGRKMTEPGLNTNSTNIIYDVDVTADPRLNVKVVLDELTGDEIKGKGNGTLKIRSGTSEPLSLRGRFDIDEGNYLFTFQSFFKKPFELKKGADNFIEWNGDPYDARINLTATYTANNVSYAPLANHWTNIDQKISNARSDVYVVAKLTDKLFNPKINFRLEFPTSSVANDDPALAFSLQQLQKNTSEMNKQATYLVVFGIFAPIENSGSVSIQEIATNSLSGIFFNVINEQVRKIVSSIFKTEKFNFNFSSSVYNRNVIAQNNKFSLGSNVNASVELLIKNNLIITVGGSVEGLLQTGTIQQNIQAFPNVTLEILLNAKGTFRANLFYRQNIDYLTTSSSGAGRTNRAGLGFSYRKEADTFWELFFKKKKPAAIKKPEEQPGMKKEGELE